MLKRKTAAQVHTHTHTHTHIYIYIERERGVCLLTESLLYAEYNWF